jgi:hypothetical protein
MTNKNIWSGFVTVFVTTQLIEGFMEFILLGPTYSHSPQIWRPIAEIKLWMLPVTGAFFSFFFVFIFSKGYEGRGLFEGVRYGTYAALMIVLPHAYNSYATLQISYSVALQWFICGKLEYIIAGALLSAVFQLSGNSPTSP